MWEQTQRFRTQLRFPGTGDGFSCQVETSQASLLDADLATFVTKIHLDITSYWGNRAEVNMLHVLHVSSGGPSIRLVPDEEDDRAFCKEHANCLGSNRALVLQISETRQLILAPVMSTRSDGQQTPVFWGFACRPGLPTLANNTLHKSRLCLIFDLDETLLVANSASTLEGRLELCRKSKVNQCQELATKMDKPEERERSEATILCLDKEEELLQHDLDLLRQFTNTTSIKVQGKMYTPRLEPAHLEDGTVIKRPVIKLNDGLVVLTRINPNENKTSMILRIRPGWEDLRRYLAGEVDNKQRFDVYVCTAAERSYALEVWRVLDVMGNIIPQDKRKARIVNVTAGRKKTLHHSLGLLNPAQAAEVAMEMSEAPQGAPGNSLFPLALVVDDRLEVWEEADQAHVLQVMPWMYYRDEANRKAGVNSWTAHMSEKELVRVRNSVVNIRGDLYQVLNQVVKPKLDLVYKGGVLEEGQATMTELLPPVKTVPALLQDPAWSAIYGLPKMPTVPGSGALRGTPPVEDLAGPTAAAYLALPNASTLPKQPSLKARMDAKKKALAPTSKRPATEPMRPSNRPHESSGIPTAGATNMSRVSPPAIKDLAAWSLDAMDDEEGPELEAGLSHLDLAVMGADAARTGSTEGVQSDIQDQAVEEEAAQQGEEEDGDDEAMQGTSSGLQDEEADAAKKQQQAKQMACVIELLALPLSTQQLPDGGEGMVMQRLSEIAMSDMHLSGVLQAVLQAVSETPSLMPDARVIMGVCWAQPHTTQMCNEFIHKGNDVKVQMATLAAAFRSQHQLVPPEQPGQEGMYESVQGMGEPLGSLHVHESEGDEEPAEGQEEDVEEEQPKNNARQRHGRYRGGNHRGRRGGGKHGQGRSGREGGQAGGGRHGGSNKSKKDRGRQREHGHGGDGSPASKRRHHSSNAGGGQRKFPDGSPTAFRRNIGNNITNTASKSGDPMTGVPPALPYHQKHCQAASPVSQSPQHVSCRP